MKQSIYKISTTFAILCFIFAFALVVKAQGTGSTNPNMDDGSTHVNPIITPTIKATIENRIEMNRDVRNTTLEKRQAVQTERRDDVKAVNMQGRQDIKDMMTANREERKIIDASSTDMFKKIKQDGKDAKAEILKKMERSKFDIRKNALVQQLTISLDNLQNISDRIGSRITKSESENHDMTSVKVLFATANDKLVKAKADVAAFQALNITPSTPVAGTTTVQIDLTKPRILGDTAIKSVRDARDAFRKVVDAIGHAVGIGGNGSTTPPNSSN